MARKTHLTIKEIYVENLFGFFTYKIPQDLPIAKAAPMFLLYGDNGSGKTTILKILFYLLSTVDRDGRKSNVAEIKFSIFRITLSSGIQIIAERQEAKEGTFDFVINDSQSELYRLKLISDSSNRIQLADDTQERFRYEEMLEFIESLNISVFLLGDNRKLRSGAQSERRSSRKSLVFDSHGNPKEKNESDGLIDAVQKLEGYIRKKVIQASRAGERNTNSIYSDIVKRLTYSQIEYSDLGDKKQNLVDQLKGIRERSSSYFNQGLISRIESKEIEEILKGLDDDKIELMLNVLDPYVDGLQSKLDSLKNIHNLIQDFTDSINSYFSHKKLNYNLNTGFSIKHDKTKTPIDFKMLSSGERHLFLLICNVITASDEARIFIIDEPEISLNVKWQRRLSKTLLDFASGRNVQFILATHSIELLSDQKEFVCQLENLNN